MGRVHYKLGAIGTLSSVFAFCDERALTKSNYRSSLVPMLISLFCTGMSLSTRGALNNCMQLKQASV